MPLKAVIAKKKDDPLVVNGTPVFVAYDSKAFETRQLTSARGWTYTRDRLPTTEFSEWMVKNCGPMGVLWRTEKASDGLWIYFAVKSQALMFKLAWGGV